MTDTLSHALLKAFYKAYANGDGAKAAPYLADDVEWCISGPVDVLSYCGTRRGKAAVVDLIEHGIPSVFRITSFIPESMLVEGDRAATLIRLSGRCPDGRIISYRLAHFTRFRDGKIARNLSIIESFNAAEQVLGHALTTHDDAHAHYGDLIAV